MNKSTFFKVIQAPLKNTRWSWGAVRADGKVILAVWNNDVLNGTVILRGTEDRGPGGAERDLHVASSASFFCVMCQGDYKMGIQSLDHRQLWFVSEKFTDERGNVRGKLSHRVAIGELI